MYKIENTRILLNQRFLCFLFFTTVHFRFYVPCTPKYKIGQEETLGALGLVTNLVIYWNTIYMQAALIKLKEEGYPIIEEDLYHLSPLLHEHINFVGKYNFHSKLEISGTKLRALNPSTYSQEKKNVRI